MAGYAALQWRAQPPQALRCACPRALAAPCRGWRKRCRIAPSCVAPPSRQLLLLPVREPQAGAAQRCHEGWCGGAVELCGRHAPWLVYIQCQAQHATAPYDGLACLVTAIFHLHAAPLRVTAVVIADAAGVLSGCCCLCALRRWCTVCGIAAPCPTLLGW